MDYYEAKNFVWLGICEIIFLRGGEHYVRQHRASVEVMLLWKALFSQLLFTMDYFLEKKNFDDIDASKVSQRRKKEQNLDSILKKKKQSGPEK